MYLRATPTDFAIAWNWGAKAALFYAGTNLLCNIWCWFRLPETKGRTFGEIDLLFEHGVPARKFKYTSVNRKSIRYNHLSIKQSRSLTTLLRIRRRWLGLQQHAPRREERYRACGCLERIVHVRRLSCNCFSRSCGIKTVGRENAWVVMLLLY